LLFSQARQVLVVTPPLLFSYSWHRLHPDDIIFTLSPFWHPVFISFLLARKKVFPWSQACELSLCKWSIPPAPQQYQSGSNIHLHLWW
jgi:hypothetical protein